MFIFFSPQHNCIFIMFSILKHFCSILAFILLCCPFSCICLTRPFNSSSLRLLNKAEMLLSSQALREVIRSHGY